jgi:hypothetical protein
MLSTHDAHAHRLMEYRKSFLYVNQSRNILFPQSKGVKRYQKQVTITNLIPLFIKTYFKRATITKI